MNRFVSSFDPEYFLLWVGFACTLLWDCTAIELVVIVQCFVRIYGLNIPRTALDCLRERLEKIGEVSCLVIARATTLDKY